MVWDTGLKKTRNFNFRHLRWHLLLSYLTVMAAILFIFALGIYLFFSSSFYQQLDEKLRTLAQSAAPSLSQVEKQGNQYLNQMSVFPWRDLFNRNQQSLQWFNAQGQLLAQRGQLVFRLSPQTTNLESNDQFIQGYQMGKQCNQVLYDASQIPVQEVRMALALDLSQNSVPSYLLGIQLGWRLAIIEQSLTRFLPDEKSTIA